MQSQSEAFAEIAEDSDELPMEMEVDLPSVQMSRRLSLIGLCLLFLYVVFVVNAVLPIQLLNILWQVRLSTSVVEHAPIVLLGVILIWLASYLDPGNPDLVKKQQFVARLCLVVSLGFLLLIPLRMYQIFSVQQTLGSVQDRKINQGLRTVSKIKEALKQANSREDLERRLKAAEAPPLPPGLQQRSLPELREGLTRSLNQAESSLLKRRPQRATSPDLNSFMANAKMMLSSLLYAAAFAAAGQRSSSEENFLDEVMSIARSLVVKPEPAEDPTMEYLEQLSDDDEANYR